MNTMRFRYTVETQCIASPHAKTQSIASLPAEMRFVMNLRKTVFLLNPKTCHLLCGE